MDNQNMAQQPFLTFFSDDTAEYDVIVDQASSAPNLKEATWGALQPLMPLITDRMGPEEFALILEYSPLPESFNEKFKAIQDQKSQQPPPPDPVQMKIQADQQAKQAELQMKQQEGQAQMQMDAAQAQHQLQLDEGKMAAQMQLEREKAAAQIQLEREKAMAAVQLEREKAQAQMVLQTNQQRNDMAMKAVSSRHDMALKAGKTHSDMQNQAAELAQDGGAESASEAPDMESVDLFGNKAVAEAVVMMSQALVQMERSNSESIRALAEALTKPKQIVRGPDGRAIGVK